MTVYYAGIGSRSTPASIGEQMSLLAERLENRGFVLRSGGADGADTFFERGVRELKEIYLPWRGFNGNASPLFRIGDDAIRMARKYHPNPDRLSPGALKLMARNCYQVLGKNLITPVSFVVCWTPGGSGSGGTGQAIRIARDYQIPVFDLGSQTISYLEEFLGSLRN